MGFEYLRNEPLKEYEERKKAEEEKEKKKAENKEMKDAPPAPPAPGMDPPAPDPGGMMSGVVPGAAKSDAKKPLLPITHWGRYIKVLLSSSEFMFIN